MKTKQCKPRAAFKSDARHVEAFKALAHADRLRVFFHLVREGCECAAGEIQRAVEIPAPTLSRHLDLLRRAGLVESRREERFIHYRVRRETVAELIRLLTACC